MKLAFFHRLRTSSKHVLKQSLSDHVFHTLVTLKIPSEAQHFYEAGFGSIVHKICLKYNLTHEFHSYSDQPRNNFSRFVKKTLRGFHLALDCAAFDNSQQGALFKSAALPVLKLSKPYGGVAVNPVIFENVDRKTRLAYFQALSGTLISEYHCPAFKRRRSSSCPYCSSSCRKLEHFIFDCPEFSNARKSLNLSIRNIWQKLSLPTEPPLRSLPFLFGRFPSSLKLVKSDHRDLQHGILRSTSRFLAQISSQLNDPDAPAQPEQRPLPEASSAHPNPPPLL